MYQPYQDHNAVIERLCELYPKCFFINAKQRWPLNHNIVDDLTKANDPALTQLDVAAAVDWYTGHIGYDIACVAGAERINLDGKTVGKISESEAREAQQRIAAKSKQMAERGSVLKTAQGLYGTGGFTDDQFRKIPAPSTLKSNNSDVEQKFDEAMAALIKARELVVLDNTALRIALLKAALSVAEGSIQKIVEMVK